MSMSNIQIKVHRTKEINIHILEEDKTQIDFSPDCQSELKGDGCQIKQFLVIVRSTHHQNIRCVTLIMSRLFALK